LQWDAFEIPELNNFLHILDIEERQYADSVRRKYEQQRLYIRCEMVQRGMAVMPLDERRTGCDDSGDQATPTQQLSPDTSPSHGSYG
jgi:hypothetical protein